MRRISRYFILAFCCVLAICLLWKEYIGPGVSSDRAFSPEPSTEVRKGSWQASYIPAKMVVMGKLSTEDTDWVQEHLPEYVMETRHEGQCTDSA